MMPHAVTTPPGNGGQVPAIKQISGKKLARRLKEGTLSPELAARLAYDLNTGHVAVSKLPAKWSRMMTGATVAGLASVRRTLRATNGNGHRVLYRRNPSDADIDTVVAKIGPDKVMASLDRLTKPRGERTTEMFGASIAR
jgi:hypothetical protein